MSRVTTLSIELDPDPRSVGRARDVLRDAMARGRAGHLVDAAAVALSEVVTNALVHAGGAMQVHLWVTTDAVRVEVEDSSTHMPSMRHYAPTAGTGRGLQLVSSLVDRWGAAERSAGKVVWFEIGSASLHSDLQEDGAEVAVRRAAGRTPDVSLITLRHVPLLMHAAWQEHAAALLREYLLHVLDDDDAVLDKHARASAAMSLLHDQLPAPILPADPDALMADAIEPHVTADEVVLQIPTASLGNFETLDELLRSAIVQSRAGAFLSPPTQPEIDEMRQWMCSEVARQAAGDTTATPWLARTDVSATLADQASLTADYAQLSKVEEPLLATDGASIIVAVSQAALSLLGYRHAEQLLGRRVIVVVPARFHQAHIAGTTLHATNGRDNLLEVPIQVPMVRADGSEVSVRIEVRPQRLVDDRHVFVARFRLA